MAQITLTQAEMCKAVEYYLNNHIFRMAHTVKKVRGGGKIDNGNFEITIEQKPVETPAPKASPIEATNQATGPTMPVTKSLEGALRRND